MVAIAEKRPLSAVEPCFGVDGVDGLNWYVYVNNNPLNRIDPTGLWTQKMGAAVYNNLGQVYVYGYNDCDIWVEKTEKKANPSSTLSETWGPAASNKAEHHKANLDKKDLLSEDMSLGTNIVVQGDVHVMLASLNPDGSVDVAHSTSNPVNDEMMDEKGFSNGYSEVIKYKSEKEFKKDGWGDLQFYGLGDGGDFNDGGVYNPEEIVIEDE